MIKTANDAAMFLVQNIENVQSKEEHLRDILETMLQKHNFPEADIEKALNLVFRGTATVN